MRTYRTGQVFRGFRGHQCRELSEMRHQGSKASEKEEDKARDQDLAESFGRSQRRCTAGCCEGQSKQDAVTDL